MSKKKPTPPLPLQLVNEYTNSFKGCWEAAEYMRAGKGDDLPDWSELCYLPLTVAKEIMDHKWGMLLGSKLVDMSSLYAALASWRQYKEIYTFSAELAEDLKRQGGDDIVIPVEILYNIPYPCIFVNTEDDNRGFFVFFNQNLKTSEMELRFCFVINRPDGRLEINNLWLHLHEGYTISDGIRAGLNMVKSKIGEVKSLQRTSEGDYVEIGEEETEKYMYDIVSKLIQFVLYICAENAEVEENPRQKQITQKRREGAKPKDVYREIQKWDVGVRYAHAVRRHTSSAPSGETADKSQSTPRNAPRPHTRRGHWHHYWVGSRADNTRKLILKWTAPTFVGGESNDTITTIQKMQ